MTLAQSRCYTHPTREAVARCPECKHFFCRECVIEHNGRYICASCIASLAKSTAKTGPGLLSRIALPSAAAAACLLIWFFFYFAGTLLFKWHGAR